MQDFYVNLSPEEAVNRVTARIVNGSVTGELVDLHQIRGNGGSCVTAIYEKHYWRAGNRLTLTVVADNLGGATRIHTVGGGGGEGLFRFDWGASGSFEEEARAALEAYVL